MPTEPKVILSLDEPSELLNVMKYALEDTYFVLFHVPFMCGWLTISLLDPEFRNYSHARCLVPPYTV